MLTPTQIVETLTRALGPHVVAQAVLTGGHPWIAVPVDELLSVAQFVRDNPEIQLDMLRSVSGLDYPDKKQLGVAYDLISFTHVHEFCIKVFVPREKPEVPSVAEIWHAADWHERETYDMFGIVFTDHPDEVTDESGTHPRRILLPDDWAGFPLRKDYVFPREYQGIPGSVEIDWAQKPNYPK